MSAFVELVLGLKMVPTVSHWRLTVTATTTLSLFRDSPVFYNWSIGLTREIIPVLVILRTLLKSILLGKTSLSILGSIIVLLIVEAAFMLLVERLTLVSIVIVALVLNLVVLLSVILSLILVL